MERSTHQDKPTPVTQHDSDHQSLECDLSVTLSGNNGEQFRGFLVQVRSSPGDAILEGIAENSNDVQLHACSPSNGGVTHTSGTDKSSISFQWTPTAGTGDVVFR